MIVCIFERVEWRSAPDDSLAIRDAKRLAPAGLTAAFPPLAAQGRGRGRRRARSGRGVRGVQPRCGDGACRPGLGWRAAGRRGGDDVSAGAPLLWYKVTRLRHPSLPPLLMNGCSIGVYDL